MSTDSVTREMNITDVPVDSNKSQLTENHVLLESRTGDSIKPHTGKRRVTCPVCGKSLQFDSLRLHMRTHSGYRPYSCDVCRREFTRNSDLTTHLRMYSGKCVFTCSVCQKQFSHKRALCRHEAIHTDERRFRCSDSTAQFISLNDPGSTSVSADVTDDSCTVQYIEIVPLTRDADGPSMTECDSEGWSAEVNQEKLPTVKQEPDDVSCVFFIIAYEACFCIVYKVK